ncbi:hypothetical protein GJ496_011393, partial [Pomphorhynchus laevis]
MTRQTASLKHPSRPYRVVGMRLRKDNGLLIVDRECSPDISLREIPRCKIVIFEFHRPINSRVSESFQLLYFGM